MRPHPFSACCLAWLTALALSCSALADERPRPALTVTGHGESRALPDVARLQIGVETEAETPGEAMAANAERMTKVMAMLKDMGIADQDLRTSRLAVWPIHDTDSSRRARLTVGYRVSNQLDVTIRRLDDVGDILDRAVADGANSVHGPTFSVAEPAPFEQAARDAAVKDAIAKAKRYAETAGVALGDIIAIDEGGGGVPVSPRAMRAEAMAASTPIAAGETTFSASVRMAFAIGR